jgi:phage gp45-like
MGLIAELAKVTSTYFSKYHGSPGSVLNIEAKGLGDSSLSAEGYQHHGFASNPPKGTRVITLPIGRGRVTVAERNYQVSVDMGYGGTTIYSTTTDGKTIKARIDLDAAGKIKISNDAKSLKSILDSLIVHLAALTTINCVSGSPVTLSPSVIAQLNQDKADLALLLKD